MQADSLNRQEKGILTACDLDPVPPACVKYSIRRILRERHPQVRLRKKFLRAPLLDMVTLGQLLADPFAMADFLAECRRQPHCGDGSILSLRRVLEIEAAACRDSESVSALH